MLDLKNFKSVVKGNKKLSLEQFKSIAVQEQNQMDLEKLTGGILGACHWYWGPNDDGSGYGLHYEWGKQ